MVDLLSSSIPEQSCLFGPVKDFVIESAAAAAANWTHLLRTAVGVPPGLE